MEHRSRPHDCPPRVLIVDGHDDTRQLYEMTLSQRGFEPYGVEDGEIAFERALHTRPDVVVTEVRLARGDGWELIDDLKRDPRTRDIPIVLLTAHAESAAGRRAEREGCALVLRKPCLPDRLARGLDELLGRHSVMPAPPSACADPGEEGSSGTEREPYGTK